MPALRLGNSTVSGPLFDMRARSMTMGWQNFIEVEQQPSKSIASGLNFRLPEGKYLGHAAPVINFSGIIDTSLSDPTYEGGNPLITVAWLGSLSRVGSGWISYPHVNQYLGPPAAGNGSVSVMIRSAPITTDASFTKAGSEYMVNYTMELVVVSGPV